jgi:sterol desaturase/sphingolipid hydroxylase (fatty acid hydroxylase superfamily)
MGTLLRELQQYPQVVVDIVRLSIWLLLLMIIFVPLERLFAATPQKIFRKGWPTDLGFYFLNGLVVKAALVFPMAAIAWALRRGVPDAVHLTFAEIPLWARLAAALVMGEVGFYWGHRWTHQVPLLWRFHSIHHSSQEIDWLVNTKGHPIDVMFTRLCGFVPMYALGLAQPLVGTRIDIVPMLVLLIGTTWGYVIHANVRWRFGPLEWLIATPHFHHWHHTNDEHVDRNYASMLPIMDKLFGTAYLPAKQWPPVYGIHGHMPKGLVGQLLNPFLPEAEQPPLPEVAEERETKEVEKVTS